MKKNQGRFNQWRGHGARILLSFWLLMPAPVIHAQSVPPLINFQGKLVGSNGLPVATGDYELRFRIWDAPTGGNLVWGPQIFSGQTGAGFGPLVPVVQGWLNVMLGPMDTNSILIVGAFTAPNRFIEIQIGDSPAFAPRQQFLSAPYTLLAEKANLANQATIALSADTAMTAKTANALRPTGSLQHNSVVTTPDGNVGIGTDTPTATLEVAGQIKLTGGAPGFGRVLTSDGSGLATWQSPAGGVYSGMQAYTTPGTFTWTNPGVSKVYVRVWGAGGGGASGAFPQNNGRGGQFGGGGGGGGGSGAYFESLLPVTGDIAITVGAGGSGGVLAGFSGSDGSQGGISSFGSLTANGGGPGVGLLAGELGGDGASTPMSGILAFRGNPGGIGIAGPTGVGGAGGASSAIMGSYGFGGNGSAAASSADGRPGFPGLVIIAW